MSENIKQGNSYITQFRDILYNAGYGQEKIMSITDEDIAGIFDKADLADGVKDKKINPQELYSELKNSYAIDFETALTKYISNDNPVTMPKADSEMDVQLVSGADGSNILDCTLDKILQA